MWFRQAQFLKLPKELSLQAEGIEEKLSQHEFSPCLPSMPSSAGWVAPLDEEEAPLVHSLNGYTMVCLQLEEKILPATVVRQELEQRVKLIESREAKKVRAKEKQSLKEELMLTLLPQAFTKLIRIYGYFDPHHHAFILSTTSTKQTELFLSFLKKSLTDDIKPYDLHKFSPVLTSWLKEQNYPETLSIEKSCVLQDANEESRVIRAQHQNLFAPGIVELLNDGCTVKQLGLSWQDRVHFILNAEDCSFRSIQYLEEITDQIREMEADTVRQRFDADFYMMTQTLTQMLSDVREAILATSVNEASETQKVA